MVAWGFCNHTAEHAAPKCERDAALPVRPELPYVEFSGFEVEPVAFQFNRQAATIDAGRSQRAGLVSARRVVLERQNQLAGVLAAEELEEGVRKVLHIAVDNMLERLQLAGV
jgi:hypothetical protein